MCLRLFRLLGRLYIPQIRISIKGTLKLLGIDFAVLVKDVGVHFCNHINFRMTRVSLGGFQIAVVEFQLISSGLGKVLRHGLSKIEILSRSIKEGRGISLIHKYLNAGVVQHDVIERSEQGVPQGGPLSPLLSNIMLNELDRELEKRGHKFVRYADDCMILCKSRRSAQRTLESITKFIEGKLFLKVNREKTSVIHISKAKYLGYVFYRNKGKCRLRAITNRSKAISNEERPQALKRFIMGWVNYFKLADMKGLLKATDEWLRRRIRAIYWKQWKKVKTRYRMIRQYNLPEWKVHELANCRKGTWRAALMLNQILSNKEIDRQGYITMSAYYGQVCEN